MKTCFALALLAALFVAAAGQASSAEARDVRMVAPEIPPHFDSRGRGRIGDVVRAVMARCGHSVEFSMVPFGRHWKDYVDNTSFDGLATAEADQTFPPMCAEFYGANLLGWAEGEATGGAQSRSRIMTGRPSARTFSAKLSTWSAPQTNRMGQRSGSSS